MLSASEIESYREHGIVVPNEPIGAQIFSDIRGTLETFLAARPTVVTDYVPHLIEQDRSWLALGAAEEILDVVAQLIGDDIILRGSALFCKSTFTGKATPWHQDAQYWPIRPLETCTVWIAIDASTVENGCLEVIPGSHRLGRVDHVRRGDQTAADPDRVRHVQERLGSRGDSLDGLPLCVRRRCACVPHAGQAKYDSAGRGADFTSHWPAGRQFPDE